MEILAECGPTMTLPHLVWGWATRFLAKTRSRTGCLAAELRRFTLVDVLHRCRELRETRHFIDYDDPALHGDNPGFPEPAQNAVHVDEGQPEMIGDFLLRHPQLKPATICHPRLMQSPAQIQQQGGDPLVGVALTERCHPVMQPPIVLSELKHDPHAYGMILRDELKQALVIEEAHEGIGQALDRFRLTFEQHALDTHQITRQEDHHDLSTVILGRAGSRNPAGFQQVYRAAFLAGTDQFRALTAEAGRSHSLLEYRFATDQQITQLQTVQGITNI